MSVNKITGYTTTYYAVRVNYKEILRAQQFCIDQFGNIPSIRWFNYSGDFFFQNESDSTLFLLAAFDLT